MKIFDRETYKQNLQNHHNYIEIMYERDPEVTVNKITEMIQKSLEQIAPVTRIQLSSKNINPLSPEAREALDQRDKAQTESKTNPTHDNVRDYKNKRNTANRIITREKILQEKRKNSSKKCQTRANGEY